MSLPQQKFRELTLQMLYSADIEGVDRDALIPLMMKELAVSKRYTKIAQELIESIIEKRDSIDEIISEASKDYSIVRILPVELNIIRLSLYEILYDEDIPPKVSIAEAVRLARKFGSPGSGNFVNAILDCIYQKMNGESADSEALNRSAEHLKASLDFAEEVAKRTEED
jgi:N utilization substance protein B